MKNKFFPILTILLLIFSIYLFINIEEINNNFKKLNNLITEINTTGNNAILNINKFTEDAKIDIYKQFEDNLSKNSEVIINKKLKLFESQLIDIQKRINEETVELENIQSKKQRELLNLPELVDLDNLYNRYKDSSSVSFNTEKGLISFLNYNVTMAIIPLLQKPAWIRIGKEISSENSALIKTWLNESVNEKLTQGYKLISDKTSPSDYGEYTEKLYKKGDMYFKTYYQYIRYQGTYDSNYYRYTYYVEIGSQNRKELFLKEQYNSKIGS